MKTLKKVRRGPLKKRKKYIYKSKRPIYKTNNIKQKRLLISKFFIFFKSIFSTKKRNKTKKQKFIYFKDLNKFTVSKKLFKTHKLNVFQRFLLFIVINFKTISFSLSLSFFILSVSYLIYDYLFVGLPSIDLLVKESPNYSTRIFDRNGVLLYKIYKDENRTKVKLKDISPFLIKATLAIEDKDFYHHKGFSFKGIARAFFVNFTGNKVEGGSTITQQLVKNRLLGPQKTLKRKLREIILSILVEGKFSKDEILEMYLNQVAYGGSIYGVEEASWQYFRKHAKDLTLSEAATLAAIPKAPSIYSPYTSNKQLLFSRRNKVLKDMLKYGFIDQKQYELAKFEIPTFAPPGVEVKAPHFVFYVKDLLIKKYGRDFVEKKGLQVYTTLDYELFKKAQKIVKDEIDDIYWMNVTNGASLITNPKTGEILSMVGSRDYFDFEHDGQVNICLRPRQPGSSIKPLTYAIAFEDGALPSDFILDEPVTFKTPGAPVYKPQNYDGKFHGKVTLRQALANSYNIPAVKLLAKIGLNRYIDKAEEIGISTWTNRKRFGLALTLGGGEVLMVDMAKLYGTFANQGKTVELNPFLKIYDSDGNLLYENSCVYENKCDEKQNFSKITSFFIADVLSDNNARAQEFGLHSWLYIPPHKVAVKTGTTNDLRDNWTIGFTDKYVVAVWVGNNDNSRMRGVASGITGASPIWHKTMMLLLDDSKPFSFTKPDDLVKIPICLETKTLPCDECPHVKEVLLPKNLVPKDRCSSYDFEKRDKENKHDFNKQGII